MAEPARGDAWSADDLLRGALEHSPIVLLAVDAAGVLRAAEGRGMAAVRALVGRPSADALRDVPALAALLGRAQAGETAAAEVVAWGGSWEVHCAPLLDPGGAPRGAVCVGADASSRLRAEETARHNVQFFDRVVENIPDMIFVKDARELRFVHFNRAGEDLLGYRRDELIGKNDHDFFPADEADFFTAKDRGVLASGRLLDIPEEPIHTRQGTRILHTKKIPILDEEGRPAYLLGISEDITARKQVEAERQRLYERLRELEQLKAHLVANVSHELRTPLALVLALADRQVHRTDLDDAALTDLAAIQRNARTLLQLVNDLLDVSRLDAGQVQADYAEADLSRLVRTAASSFEVLASRRRIAFTVQAPPSLPAQIDPEKIRRVAGNLLSNALRHTPDGGAVRCAVERRDEGTAVLAVADSGPGVPPEQRAAVFDRFFQLEPGLGGGAGIGLSIVKEFTELHGGSVAVETAPEGGALFTVALPLLAPPDAQVRRSREEPAADLVLAAPAPGWRAAVEPAEEARPLVLVVEDNADMRQFLVDTLGPTYRISAAADGRAALAAAAADRPDLVLTDLMMPGMDGAELVRRLRRRPELEGVPIVALTAVADDALRVELLSGGVQDYVLKPFSPAELLARVGQLVTLRRTRVLLQEELASEREDVEALVRELAQRRRECDAAVQTARDARAHAEEALRVKGTFLALVLHELRNPLTTLRLRTQALERSAASGTVDAAQVLRMGASAERLHRLVEAILSYARVESGRLPLERRPFDARAVAAEVVEEFRIHAERRGIALRLEASAALPYLESDARQVWVILSNLVGNAVKFTERGEVVVSLSADAGGHRLTVADTGPGIPPDLQDRIFEPFERLAAAEGTAHGAGLGLAIVRELVRLLGGDIELSSRVGQGSRFTVTLPRVR
jgi:PAS domain S-box-containing protein